MRTISVLILLAFLASLSSGKLGGHHRKLKKAGLRGDEPITGQFIIIFDTSVKDVEDKANALVKQINEESGNDNEQETVEAKVLFLYDLADFKGAAIGNIPEDAFQKILNDEEILSVQEDEVLRGAADDQALPAGGDLWGLDRIDQRDLPLDHNYRYSSDGTGVYIFIIDSGVRYSHEDFNGRDLSSTSNRVTCGYHGFHNLEPPCSDGHGHGAAMASVAAGLMHGVAKNASIIDVKIMDKNGLTSTAIILDALSYITTWKNSYGRSRPAVANWSSSYRHDDLIDQAVNRAVEAGVFFTMAAGNDDIDACLLSPPSASRGVSVAASDRIDRRWTGSNWGNCVQLFAPGAWIETAASDSDTSVSWRTGTSEAAPFVAGVAALYLQRYPDWSPRMVWRHIRVDSTKDVISDRKGAPNRLLFSRRCYDSYPSCRSGEPGMAPPKNMT